MQWALWVVDLDLSSESSDAYLLHLLQLLLLPHDSLWVICEVSVLGIFSAPGPAIHTKMIFISTLVTSICPMLGILWVGVRCAAFAACLTWATLGSVVITFLELEGLDLINMVVAVATPPLDLCWLKSFTVISCSWTCWRRAVYVMSSLFFFDLTHCFYFKMLHCMEKQLCSTYQFFILSIVLASFYQFFYALI